MEDNKDPGALPVVIGFLKGMSEIEIIKEEEEIDDHIW